MIHSICVLAFAAVVLGAGPTPWSKDVSIFVDDKLPASQLMANGKPTTVSIPALAGDLQIELKDHKTVGFKLCLKQRVAAPSVAGTQGFDNPLYCDLFHFTNASSSATVHYAVGAAAQRVRSVSAALRGVGSAQRDVAASVNAAAAAGHQLARRSVSEGEGYIQRKNVRAGDYYFTIAATSKEAKNITLGMTLSGMKCDQADQDPLNNCAAYKTIQEHKSENVVNIAAKGVATRMFSDWGNIGPNTGNMQVSANLYDSPNATADVVARWGAPPTADVFDLKLTVTDDGKGKGESKMGTIGAPAKAAWFVTIFNGNLTTASVNLTVTLYQCDKDKFGADCKVEPKALGKAGELDEMDDAKKDVPLYFVYAANDTKALYEFMANVSTESIAFAAAALNPDDKAPTVMARNGMLPTAEEFDLTGCSVASCPADQATLIVPKTDVASTDTTWYVMVTPQTDNGVGVWNAAGGACAGNCGGNGNCTAATATCTCFEDYTSFDCAMTKSKLERWEWALIIGGGVLVAIGLIGCIVFFIQKQQRRAGFERV